MKILGAQRGDGPDSYFRIAAPFSVLRYSTPHQFTVRRPALGDSQEFDLLWLQRHSGPVAEAIAREFKDYDKPVIYDADDWLFGTPPSVSYFANYYDRGKGDPTANLIFHERLMRLADVVTCTNEHLATKLRERLGGTPSVGAEIRGWENPPPVEVLPNCILRGDWDTVLPLHVALEGPVVGWMGMEYHWDDWKQIAGAVDEAMEQVGGNLVILGFPEVVACFSDRLAARTHIQPAEPWRGFGILRRMMASFGVGIAWLEDTEFNWCKSPLKAFQYGAVDVPVVASKTVYGDVMEHGTHGLLAGTPDELGAAICEMVKDGGKSMAATWKDEIHTRHTYETQARQWLRIIERWIEPS